MSPEPRRDFPVPVRVDLQADDAEPRVEWAVNLSPGGVCLHAREPLEEGQRLVLRLEIPPEGPVLELKGRVVWTSRHTAVEDAPRFWEVGVRFEDTDPRVRAQLEAWASQPLDRRR